MSTSRSTWSKVLFFLALVGPGIVTGSVDNDAGGITTYSVAGATYGYNMIWTLIPAFFVLLIVQEMNARMGIVTGKGLADLIRENAGVKITFFIFVGLLIADIGNTMTEFAGVAGSMQIFGVSKYIAIPITAFAVWVLVVKGSYNIAEKIFLIFSAALLSYIVSALAGKPHWGQIGMAVVHPQFPVNLGSVSLVIGLIGTTIAPWMQFYMQSAVIEKKLRIEDYKYTLIDVVVGCVATVAVALFIMVACGSTLFANGHGTLITDAKDAALALKPLAGALAGQVFAFGLFVASIFSATILPVATAFYVCEAFGFEAGIERKWKEAPQFYILYTVILALGASIILIPNIPLISITLWSQQLNGILLPVVLICMMLLVNNKEIMGRYTNKRWMNIVGWTTITVLIILSVILIVLSL
ncbi:Nramp family divalent metal transporter [Alicyclobacillus mengziensis]|uniref:Nramp family divalent metal transporter n=1 Tax=Alicyclobacillus mengziensis TaxID=2931921 RepID=A0A9X7W1Z8_9BACL|nr:Nramp family divalent metal transporter [Alicyclobacillus mengziensis]QSO48869.1 Nramp family divalent metal transporter [Alicyclobacillus mengziensis]